MEIKYPNQTVTASELSAVNSSYIFDGICNLADFFVQVLNPASAAAASGTSGILVGPGGCWIAGRYWSTEVNTTITAAYSETEPAYIKIKCDTTGDAPVTFSIYADTEEPISSAGIWEIVIGQILAGALVEQNIPLANGGEFPGKRVYLGTGDGYIRIRKISADLAHMTINVLQTSGDHTYELSEFYLPEGLDYYHQSRAYSSAGFVFSGAAYSVSDGSLVDHPVIRLKSDGTVRIERPAVEGTTTIRADVVYPIRRGSV